MHPMIPSKNIAQRIPITISANDSSIFFATHIRIILLNIIKLFVIFLIFLLRIHEITVKFMKYRNQLA